MNSFCTGHARRLACLSALLLAVTADAANAQSSGLSASDPCRAPAAGTVAAPAPAVDLRAVARQVVGNLGITPGERVLIRGAADDVAFMEQLLVAVAALGGQPVIYILSDATVRQWYRDVPVAFDTLRDEWQWTLRQHADVVLQVGRRDPALWDDLPVERLDAYDAVNAGLGARDRERRVRWVWLGNGGIHPSPASAQRFGMTLSELECIYWRGIATDTALLAPDGRHLAQILEGATTLRVTHPNGTDITVRRGAGTIVMSDGSFPPRDNDHRGAGASDHTWYPAGEVTSGLDPESAEGRLVVERVFYGAGDIGPLTLDFSGGRLQPPASDGESEVFRALVHGDRPLSDRLTGVKFGLNPDVTDQRMLPFMGAGMISLSMGSNLYLGGDIDLPFMIFLTLADATVYVDGRVVVDNGVLRR
jgi:aminopeptidase